MRIAIRSLLLLASLAILVIALWPPKSPDPEETPAISEPTPSPEPEPTAAPGRDMVRDLLGGVAIDAGTKANEVIGEANEIRQRQIDELEAPSP